MGKVSKPISASLRDTPAGRLAKALSRMASRQNSQRSSFSLKTTTTTTKPQDLIAYTVSTSSLTIEVSMYQESEVTMGLISGGRVIILYSRFRRDRECRSLLSCASRTEHNSPSAQERFSLGTVVGYSRRGQTNSWCLSKAYLGNSSKFCHSVAETEFSR